MSSTKNGYELSAIPTFRISEYSQAIEFYVNQIGFHLSWEHRFGPSEPVYMQVEKNGLILHLTENPRFQTGVIVFVQTNGIEALHDNLIEVKNLPDITETPWGTKQFEIEDPFGNLLRFNETMV